LYKKTPDGKIIKHKPTQYLLYYLEAQGVLIPEGLIKDEEINTGKSILDVDSANSPGAMKLEEFTHGVGNGQTPTGVQPKEGTVQTAPSTSAVQKVVVQSQSTPSVSTELLKGKIALGAGVTFSVSNYRDDSLFTGPLNSSGNLAKNKMVKSTDSTTFFTFNTASIYAQFNDISKVLKSVKIDYKMELAYYDAFYEDTTEGIWNIMKNNIQAKTMYNQVVSEFGFAKDITLGFGFIFRNYFGDQDDGNIYNKLNAYMIDKFDAEGDIKHYTDGTLAVNTKDELKKAYYDQRYDFWNFGIAMQFKYKIPVDWLQFPILFVNLGLGWDPFDDDGSTTQNWYKDKDSAHADSWSKNNTDWTSERSVFTIGLVWDF